MSIRIATSTVYQNAIAGLQNQSEQLQNLQTQLSTQQSVNKPSDNPAAAAQSIRLQARVATLTANSVLLNSAQSMLQQADSAFSSVTTALQSGNNSMLQAANTGTLNSADRAAVAQQLKGVFDNLLSIANQQDSNGRYLFGGTGSEQAPFVNNGSVTFQGLAGQTLAGTSPDLALSQDGENAFMSIPSDGGGTQSVFDTLQNAINVLNDPNATDAQVQTAMKSGMADLNAAMDRISTVHTQVGVSLNVITSQQSANDNLTTSLNTQQQGLVGIDLPTVLVNYTATQTAMQAAMKTYSQIAGMSMFQYL